MKSSVDMITPTVAAMVTAGAKGRALMGGTTAMRAAGTAYLPKFEAEAHADYSTRLGQSWLFNGYRKTVRDMAGRVFAKSVELQAPPELEAWCDNVDLQGRDLSTFSNAVFKDALSGSGVSYIMVDAPPRQGVVTRTQAQSQGLRPYMIHLRVEDIIGWRTTTVGNATVLGQIRIMETVCEPDPKDEFRDIEVAQIRVMDRLTGGVMVRVYRKPQNGDWIVIDEFMTGQREITIAPVYSNRTGFFTGEPLLDDLADVNIAHWQSQSDQRNILSRARLPLLFAAGFATEDKIIIAPTAATITSNSDAKLGWVEHSGRAIEAGRTDLKDLEFQMEAHGMQLLVAKTQSATGEALDAAKETSILAMTADALQDALEQALTWMADYGGLSGDITAKVNKEFGSGIMTAPEMTVLLSAVNTGNLSRVTFIGELAKRGIIAPDTDAQDEVDRIDAEGGGLEIQAAA